ncbi:hypothetical protein BDQ17DRAFT_1356822 [Cyathus striatus]|nr:hypothetical protein BDQ17DRAFT_1356822 [Cyathus striatus]
MALTIRDRRSAPLWGLRLITLLLAWAWAIIAVGVALIKSNQQQTRLRNQVPAGTTLDINVKDVFNTGVIVTTIAACIGVLTTVLLLLHLSRPTLLTSSLKIQGSILAFFTVWLFAVQVAFTHFFRTRSAGELPSSIVQSVERGLGSTSVRNPTMVTILFSLLATTMLFKAASRARRASTAVSPTSATETRGTNSGEGMVEKDRGVSTERERAVSTEKGADA